MPFWIAAVLLLPLLFTQGMFFDGLTFAAIARNLNEGVGQFWSPQYTPYVHPEYFEHPRTCEVYFRDDGNSPSAGNSAVALPAF